jgi:hypothetical protein
LAGKLKYCKITDCPANISDHQGVEACITMDSSPSGPRTFRSAPLVEKDTGYQNSVRHLINEELILLSQISDKTRDEELEEKNRGCLTLDRTKLSIKTRKLNSWQNSQTA